MHFLGCLFVLLLALLMIGFAFIGSVISFFLSLFGIDRKVTRQRHSQSGWQQQSARQDTSQYGEKKQSQSSHSSGRQTQKIFEKDDSEYVDFEEIK